MLVRWFACLLSRCGSRSLLNLLWYFHRLNANELLFELRIVDVKVDELVLLEDRGLLYVVIYVRLFLINYLSNIWLILRLILILDDYFDWIHLSPLLLCSIGVHKLNIIASLGNRSRAEVVFLVWRTGSHAFEYLHAVDFVAAEELVALPAARQSVWVNGSQSASFVAIIPPMVELLLREACLQV